MASLGEYSALTWPWGGKLVWPQAPGPQWGEKEPREPLLFTRGLHCGLLGSALDTYKVLRCTPSSVHSAADFCCASPGLAVEDRVSMERLLRACTCVTGSHLSGFRGGRICCFFLLRDRHGQGHLNLYAGQRLFFLEMRFRLRARTSECLERFRTPLYVT